MLKNFYRILRTEDEGTKKKKKNRELNYFLDEGDEAIERADYQYREHVIIAISNRPRPLKSLVRICGPLAS